MQYYPSCIELIEKDLTLRQKFFVSSTNQLLSSVKMIMYELLTIGLGMYNDCKTVIPKNPFKKRILSSSNIQNNALYKIKKLLENQKFANNTKCNVLLKTLPIIVLSKIRGT